MTTHITTECSSPEGITVGLIDAINTISKVLVLRDLSHPTVKEALKDLRDDSSFRTIQMVMDTTI